MSEEVKKEEIKTREAEKKEEQIEKQQEIVKENGTEVKHEEKKDDVENTVIKEEESKVHDDEEEEKRKYFEGVKQSIGDLTAEKISEETCGVIVESVEEMIIGNKLSLAEDRKDTSQLMKQAQILVNQEKFEKNIKEQKLKEQRKAKAALEDKLRFLDTDISRIQDEIEPSADTAGAKQRVRLTAPKEETEEEKRIRLEQIKELARDRKERELKREKALKEKTARDLEEEKKRIEKEQLEKALKEKERREEIEKKIAEIKEKTEKRNEKLKTQEEELKKVKAQVPLFEKLHKMGQNIELEALDEKKKKLAAIREFYRPIQLEEIKEHEKKFQEKMKALHDMSSYKDNSFQYKRPFLSETYKRVAAEHKSLQEQLKQEEEEANKKIEKRREYSKLHEGKNLKPDPLKQTQMQQMLTALEHKPNFHWFKSKKLHSTTNTQNNNFNNHSKSQDDLLSDADKTTNTKSVLLPIVPENMSQVVEKQQRSSTPRAIGKSYLVQLREERQKAQETQRKKKELSQQGQSTPEQLSKISSEPLFVKINQTPTERAAPSKIDYLKDRRSQREQQQNSTKLIDWDRFLKKNENIEKSGQAQLLLLEAQKLEKLAQRKELLMKVQKKQDLNAEIDLDKEIYDGYINAIKAKLSVFELSKQ